MVGVKDKDGEAVRQSPAIISRELREGLKMK